MASSFSSSLSSSSSFSSYNPKKYDVFISFSGEDVRYTFHSHLIGALRRNQISVFEEETMERGKEISPAILNAIKESHISVVIFSKNYPYSSWCLEELAQILDCFETMNQPIIPVFYHVDPSQVQNLEGNFKDALIKHTQQFNHALQEVESWRHAFKEISCISGFVSSATVPESKFIDEIVAFISEKLTYLYPSDSQSDGVSGVDVRVRRVESLLCIELIDQVRIVGIWGMGGIGKTTIADRVYNKIKKNFDAHCFILNVREALEGRRPIDLRDQIIRELLGEKDLRIGTPQSIETSVKRRLQCRKVLIVLDDVTDSNRLRSILGDSGLYSPGSRIIVTSRDRQVLKNIGTKEYIYQVEGLNDGEALKLFSFHAFRGIHPKEDHMKLSQKAIKYAGGIPLALIVLGSNLYDKSKEEWEDELEKLKKDPDMDILKILRISYDGLERIEKSIFLDIACLFKGCLASWVKEIMKSFGFFPERGIKRLSDKSLISYYPYVNCSILAMHDLLEQMGKEIVIQESNDNLGGQSRLWNYEDIILVLRNDKLGTRKVEAIFLFLKDHDEEVEISSKAFMKMHNLRFLRISSSPLSTHESLYSPHTGGEIKLLLPNGLEYLPGNLRYLWWESYPLTYLPSKFCPDKLVQLCMSFSRLKELWDVNKSLRSLKNIDLSFSKDLISFPDFSKAPNLEVLNLEECSSLVDISCSKIQCNLRVLILRGTAIERLPAEIGFTVNLETLDLSRCSKLASLPDSICNLKNLYQLSVSKCKNLHHSPKNLGNLQNLESLVADESGIQELPDSTNQLKKLKNLHCSGCKGLKLPPLNRLCSMWIINLSHCHLTEFPDSLCSLTSLESILLTENDFRSIPASINELSKLRELDLSDCKRLEYLPELPLSLQILNAANCTSLESVSSAVVPTLNIILSNCINLNKEAASTIINYVMENHLSDESYYEFNSCRLLCIAGSEVPQKMLYKNDNGSSLSVIFDRNYLNGYSLCVVLGSTVHLPPTCQLVDIQCYARLTGMSGRTIDTIMCFGFPHECIQKSQSETIILCYKHNELCKFEHASKISFQFYALYEEDDEYIEDKALILKCGVHPIFEEGQESSCFNLPSLSVNRQIEHQDNEDETNIHPIFKEAEQNAIRRLEGGGANLLNPLSLLENRKRKREDNEDSTNSCVTDSNLSITL